MGDGRCLKLEMGGALNWRWEMGDGRRGRGRGGRGNRVANDS
jgi:hypothetical protein